MKRPFKNSKQTRRVRLDKSKPRLFFYGSGRGSSQKPERSPNASEQDYAILQSKFSNIINFTIAAIILIGIIYMSILQPDAQVKLEGEKVYPRAKSSYEEGINRQLKSSVFYRNKLTFDAESLRKKIEAAFPEVNETNIAISLFRHRPVVEIRLAKPTTKLITEDRVYILDEEGRALFEQKDASKQLDTESLLTIRDSSGQSIELGKPALAESQIGYIREIIGQMKAYKKLKPRFFLLSNGGTGLNVRFDGLSYYARFSFYADPRQSSGAFIALYEQFNREGTAPSEYVDLRIPEKAFVK